MMKMSLRIQVSHRDNLPSIQLGESRSCSPVKSMIALHSRAHFLIQICEEMSRGGLIKPLDVPGTGRDGVPGVGTRALRLQV